MAIVSVPLHVTCPEVTSIDSTLELSLSFLIMILPVPVVTAFEKVSVKFALSQTLFAPSTGESKYIVGGSPSSSTAGQSPLELRENG